MLARPNTNVNTNREPNTEKREQYEVTHVLSDSSIDPASDDAARAWRHVGAAVAGRHGSGADRHGADGCGAGAAIRRGLRADGRAALALDAESDRQRFRVLADSRAARELPSFVDGGVERR